MINNKILLNPKKKIAVAMSGGADSTYTAYILKKEGFDVIGVTAKFFLAPNSKQCHQNIKAIQNNAKKIGIKHHFIDLSKAFKQDVVNYYLDEYQSCQTPNPCVVCNQKIKFGLLFEKMLKLGATLIATGHYAKIVETPEGQMIYKAKDKSKDQSYFLWKLPKKKLNHILFPLGNRAKKEVIEEVKKIGLKISPSESQDVCFLAGQTNQQFLKKYLKSSPGKIIDQTGKVLGKHLGLFNYTIGQRHNLGLNSPQPFYVLELNCHENMLVVGSKNDLLSKEFDIDEVNWFVDDPEKIHHLKVKTRYRQQEIGCHLHHYHVSLEKDISAITPGQSAVFYDGERLIGGGIIKKVYK